LDAGGAHWLPQLTQFAVTVDRLTQALPQRLRLPQSTTQVPDSHTSFDEQELLHEPQYCSDVWRSTAPVQLPHWLPEQAWLPLLQLPQLRDAPAKQATH
jgi:hypothetical protein